MNKIISFGDFRYRGLALPTLVLVDMHRDLAVSPALSGDEPRIVSCRVALKHARASGIPVAFTRQVAMPHNMLVSPVYPRWIEGFEPTRRDMVFDRNLASCYASPEFRDMADDIGGHYLMAGRFGELSCLATIIDAFHRDHRPAFLTDALVSRPGDETEAIGRAVTCILSHYAIPTLTRSWIAATSISVGAEL